MAHQLPAPARLPRNPTPSDYFEAAIETRRRARSLTTTSAEDGTAIYLPGTPEQWAHTSYLNRIAGEFSRAGIVASQLEVAEAA